MSANPFLTLTVRGKREVLVLRQKARWIAQLLRFAPLEQTCIAAGAFAVACQAQGELGKARICFQIEQGQLHIFVQESTQEKPLLRLVKPLPPERGLAEVDIAWVVGSLDHAGGTMFDEIVKQNQEVLSLLHELQASGGYPQPQEEKPKNPSAA